MHVVKDCQLPINIWRKEVLVSRVVEKVEIMPSGGPNSEANTFEGKISISDSDPKDGLVMADGVASATMVDGAIGGVEITEKDDNAELGLDISGCKEGMLHRNVGSSL